MEDLAFCGEFNDEFGRNPNIFVCDTYYFDFSKNVEQYIMNILDWWNEQLAKIRPVNYQAYLQTRKWKNKRYRALRRARYSCQINEQHTKNLHVHHRTYKRLGFERPQDLIVVCAMCHATIHNTQMFPTKRNQSVRKIVVNDAFSLDMNIHDPN